MNVTDSEAREAAFQLWASWAEQSSIVDGIRVNIAAMKTAIAATEDARVLHEGRKNSAGRPLDIVAPSAWHAACCLLVATLTNRSSRRSFEDHAAFEDYYGNRAIFRGQARPWQITPTSWRSRFPTRRGLSAVARYVGSLSTEHDAPEFELFGRIRSMREAAALGQHYGMPTTLVDFTFDPLAAVFFALSDTGSSPSSEGGLTDHAVVYSAPLSQLAKHGGIQFTFPPVQAGRLFRQSGLFVDFGSRRKPSPSGSRASEGMSVVEQCCGRCFFPREYPVDPDVPFFNKEYYLSPEPFFEELVEAAQSFARSKGAESSTSYLDARISARPPWYVGSIDGGGFYTDDSLLVIGRVIERYLSFAALINCMDGPRFDPAILNMIAQHDGRVLSAIHELSTLKGSSLEALGSAAHEIRRSFSVLDGARRHFYPDS